MNYFKRLYKIIKTKQAIKQAELDLELKQSTCNHLYEYAGSKEYIDFLFLILVCAINTQLFVINVVLSTNHYQSVKLNF